MLSSVVSSVVSSVRRRATPLPAATPSGRSPGRLPVGVNVVGYLDRTSGLAERARVLVEVLDAAGIPHSEWPVGSTASPIEIGGDAAVPGASDAAPVVYGTTIAVVTAAAFPQLVDTHRELVTHRAGGVERVIGYWFWEVAAIPASHRAAIDLVDEIWAPTHFVADAYRAVTDTPVHLVPLPIACPPPPAFGRAELGLDERFTFMVSFDHLSVMERKHPLGAIEAFVRAFPCGDEPVRMLIKCLNGRVRPHSHSVLLAAADRDPRVDVLDAHTGAERHMALIGHVDAYVSLHRSEGLGLQPAAAMWLGTPVIASRYSGTLDLMDDESADLVEVELIPARNTDGAYPPEASWADPDLDQAAAAMRRLVADPGHRASVARAARTRREGDAGIAAAGGLVADLVARGDAPVASVAPVPEPLPATTPRADVRSVARAATAPVRNYINHHFEMVKDEVRTQGGDRVHLANLIHELEATVAETGLHQARTLARLREESLALAERVAELERVIERLTAVVAAGLTQPTDDPA